MQATASPCCGSHCSNRLRVMPARMPLCSGGVHQTPSRRANRLEVEASVTCPVWFSMTQSVAPLALASARPSTLLR
jgi:hypothetical protein